MSTFAVPSAEYGLKTFVDLRFSEIEAQILECHFYSAQIAVEMRGSLVFHNGFARLFVKSSQIEVTIIA